MNLKQLSDQNLLLQTKLKVKDECEILTTLLWHFKEIESRRLFSELQYSSMLEMIIREYNYSRHEANRRVDAMRLLKDLPQIEEKINSGELNLTHLNLASTLFKQEKRLKNEMPEETKLELLEEISSQSTREATKTIFGYSSQPELLFKHDKTKQVSQDKIELTFVASEALEEKIKILKGLLAHKHPNLSNGELFEMLCDLGLQEWDPSKTKSKRKTSATAHAISEVNVEPAANLNCEPECSAPNTHQVTARSEQTKVSYAKSRRQIYLRAQNKCENCGSGHALEIDHIIPVAKGGADKPENMRLLCRACNQRAAITEFGQQKIGEYLQ